MVTIEKTSRILKSWLGVLVVATISTGTAAKAQLPGSPPYLEALSDLRAARAYIAADPRPQNGNERSHELDEITRAIREIKKAAIDDGKDLNFTPPTDSQGMAAGPLHEAIRLLRKAHDDCFGATDMPNAVGMKIRALQHIDEAKATLLRYLSESGTS
jgi:hypothetical protein